MTVIDLVRTRTTAAPSHSLPRHATDFVFVGAAWAVAVTAAALMPLEHAGVAKAALFVHLMSMAVGFGAVVMVDVYGLLWLLGHRTLSEVMALVKAAHGVIGLGVGGLLASGIALKPDITSPLARVKLALVLVLMLNGVAAQRTLHRLCASLPEQVRGANIPWAVFQRVLSAALISQSTWWGAITIGFLTNANRRV
ncbi:MAG TPA: hypothetical protein VFS16_19135 [Acidimicrobiia bacterium]|nr:hypothetical protein [Acidimicrobiia bacterium]